MTVSQDFLAAQLGRLIDEVRQLRVVGDVDRANARSLNDNTVAAIARHVGALDAKLEIGIADLQEQLAALQEQAGRLVMLITDIARKVGA